MSQISSPGNQRRLQASSAKAYTTKDLYLGYSLVGPAGLFKHFHTCSYICSHLVVWFLHVFACHCCTFTVKYSCLSQEVMESWRPNLWVKSQGRQVELGSLVNIFHRRFTGPGWSNLLEKRRVSWNSAIRQMRCNLASRWSKPPVQKRWKLQSKHSVGCFVTYLTSLYQLQRDGDQGIKVFVILACPSPVMLYQLWTSVRGCLAETETC